MRSAEREHYGLAVSCARRFAARGLPMEELVSEAEAALLWAASRFDESRGVRFSTYAIPVVLGALKELCRRSTPMHVPRTDVRILSRAEAARAQLRAQNGCEPGVADVAQAVGVTAERLSEMLGARERMQGMAGDEALGSAGGECFEDWVLCREVVRSLPRPYAQVVWLRCVLGVSQGEIARQLGVSQPQVCRWEQQGKERLREALMDSAWN